MKSKLADNYVVINLIFYASVVCTQLLLCTSIYSAILFVMQVLMMGGLLFSVVPDILFNCGIGDINIAYVRTDLLTKLLIITCIYNDFKIKNNLLIVIAVGMLSIVNMWSVYFLWKQLRKISIRKKEIIKIICNREEKNSGEFIKYLVGSSVNIALFLNMQETIVEIIIFSILCIGVQLFLSEKLLAVMKSSAHICIGKYRLILWIIHIAAMMACLLNLEMFCYAVEGIYWMVIIDTIMQNKSAAIC